MSLPWTYYAAIWLARGAFPFHRLSGVYHPDNVLRNIIWWIFKSPNYSWSWLGDRIYIRSRCDIATNPTTGSKYSLDIQSSFPTLSLYVGKWDMRLPIKWASWEFFWCFLLRSFRWYTWAEGLDFCWCRSRRQRSSLLRYSNTTVQNLVCRALKIYTIPIERSTYCVLDCL